MVFLYGFCYFNERAIAYYNGLSCINASELDCCRAKVRKSEPNEVAKGIKADKDKKVALANIDINNYASMNVSNHDFVSAFLKFYCENYVAKDFYVLSDVENQYVKLQQTYSLIIFRFSMCFSLQLGLA